MFFRTQTWQRKALWVTSIVVLSVLADTRHGQAALVTTLINPGFETNDGSTLFQFDEDVNEYFEYDGVNSNAAAIANYSTGGYAANPQTWPMITGLAALKLDVRDNAPDTWVFQSLGVVTQADIDAGLNYGLAIEAGTRVSNSDAFSGNITVSFRTEVTTTGTFGNLLGSDGTLLVSQPGGGSAVPIPLLSTPSAVFSPTIADLGKEVFAVVSAETVLSRPSNQGSQYYLDNLSLEVTPSGGPVPEPSTYALAILGLLGLLAWRRRR